MGVFRDNDNKPYILSCVKKATDKINSGNLDHEYAPIDGIASYVDKCLKLAYGPDNNFYKNKTIAGAQSISGTGSIRLGFELLSQFYPKKGAKVLIPDQTWPGLYIDLSLIKWASKDKTIDTMNLSQSHSTLMAC